MLSEVWLLVRRPTAFLVLAAVRSAPTVLFCAQRCKERTALELETIDYSIASVLQAASSSFTPTAFHARGG